MHLRNTFPDYIKVCLELRITVTERESLLEMSLTHAKVTLATYDLKLVLTSCSYMFDENLKVQWNSILKTWRVYILRCWLRSLRSKGVRHNLMNVLETKRSMFGTTWQKVSRLSSSCDEMKS